MREGKCSYECSRDELVDAAGNGGKDQTIERNFAVEE